jgi:hypothetical protein
LIAALSDTHMPKGGRALPERAAELLGEAEAALQSKPGRPVFEHVWL